MHGEETAEFAYYFGRKDPIMIANKLDEDFRDHGPLNLSWSDAVVQPETGWSEEKVDLEVIRKFLRQMISIRGAAKQPSFVGRTAPTCFD